jgi:hypothetical protein
MKETTPALEHDRVIEEYKKDVEPMAELERLLETRDGSE